MVFGFFKKKTKASDELNNEVDKLFVSNLKAIINKDRARHGQPPSDDNRALVVDLMFNEVINSASVWLNGRNFMKESNRQELAVVGYVATYFTHAVAQSFRLSETETTIIVDEITETVLPDMFAQNPNFDKTQFLEDTHTTVRDVMVQKYTPQQMLDVVGTILNQCIIDLDEESKEYEGRKKLLGLIRMISDNVGSSLSK